MYLLRFCAFAGKFHAKAQRRSFFMGYALLFPSWLFAGLKDI